MSKEQKRDELLANYVLKGNVLKRVPIDILPKLSGVIDGLAAEVLSDDSVEIYHLDRSGKGVKAVPFLYWRKGEVAERSSTRGMTWIMWFQKGGLNKGLFVSKTLRVLVPLLA